MLSFKSIFINYILKYRRNFVIFSFLNIISLIVYLYCPYILSEIIDNGIISNNKNFIIKTSILLIALYAVGSISTFFANSISANISIKCYINLDYYILDHVQHLPLKFFQSTDTVYLSNKMNEDTEDIISFILNNIVNLLLNGIMILSISIITLYKAGFTLFLIFFVTCLLDLLSYYIYKNKIYGINFEKKEITNQFFSILNYQLLQIKFIKTNLIYEFIKSASINVYEKFVKCINRYAEINNSYVYFGKFLKNISLVFSLFVGGIICLNGNLNIGILISIIAYFNIGYSCLDEFHDFGKKYQETNVCLSRINEMLSHEVEQDGKINLSDLQSININDIKFGYDSDNSDNVLIALNDIQFSKGNVYLVKGNNGCGKSTFIDLLLRLYKLPDNSMYFDSTDINEINLHSLRKNLLSVAEQDTHILNQSINMNLYLDKNEHNDRLLYNLLDLLNFKDKYNELNCYEQSNQDLDKLLSGGEKQKISIIRTILKDTPVLIFDEPTSALDKKSINGFRTILSKIINDKIIIIVTHGSELDDIANKILYF